ncbi:hypothetical protein ACFQX6_57185 [Streptosporangium lutulentum]
MRSSRYMNGGAETAPSPWNVPGLGGPTGLGTSAARVRLAPGVTGPGGVRSFTHVPYEQVGPVPLPEFHMPFPARMNPRVDTARRNTAKWVREMGMFEPLPGFPGLVIWNEHKLDSYDFAVCAGALDPDAPGPQLDLSTCWLAWGTYADDYFPVVFGPRRDMIGAKAQNGRLSAFMPLDLGATPPPRTRWNADWPTCGPVRRPRCRWRRGAGSARPSRT